MNILKEIFKNSIVSDTVKDIFYAGNEGDLLPIMIDPAQYNTPDGQSGWGFDSIGGDFKYFKYSGFSSAVSAYENCPPIAAIINRKTQTFINGKTWILDEKGEVAETPAAKKFRKLINQPNPLQNWRAFEAQMHTFFHLFGFCIILPIKPFGYSNIDAKSLWNIPASWIDIQMTQESFTRLGGVFLKEIVINFNGKRIPIAIEELIIIRDITPSFTNLTFPGNKICPLTLPINNIIGAYESRNVLINFRGALGILTQDPGKGQFVSTPMTLPQKEALQKDFKRYGLRAKQFQVILTTASLKWQSMGYPTKDLMLMEEVEESTIACCSGINFPPFILGLADTTYNNMDNAEKGLYQNATIPDAENIYEQLTSSFALAEEGLVLNKDFSHIPVLQANQKELAEARKALNEALKIEWETDQLTLDEWRIKNGEDPLPKGRGKLYRSEYMKQYGKTEESGAATAPSEAA